MKKFPKEVEKRRQVGRIAENKLGRALGHVLKRIPKGTYSLDDWPPEILSAGMILMEKKNLAHTEAEATMTVEDEKILNVEDQWVRRCLEQAVCSDILRKETWGGRSRQIFEQEGLPEYKGQVGEVVKKFTCKTGEYESGWSSTDYWTGEVDSEFASLSSAKLHTVYVIRLDWPHWTQFSILAEHCDRYAHAVKDVMEKLDAAREVA